MSSRRPLHRDTRVTLFPFGPNRPPGRRTAWVLVLLAALIALVTGCGGASPAPAATTGPAEELLARIPSPFGADPQAQRTLVGDVTGTSTYVALVVSGDRAVGYFCDGERRWGWLTGAVDGDQVLLSNDSGASIAASLVGGSATGVLTEAAGVQSLTGAPFQVHLAGDGEGLFRSVSDRDGERFTLGWILTDRGARGVEISGDGDAEDRLANETTADSPPGGGGTVVSEAQVLLDNTDISALRTCQQIQQAIDQHHAMAIRLNRGKPKTQEIKDLISAIANNIANLQDLQVIEGCRP